MDRTLKMNKGERQMWIGVKKNKRMVVGIRNEANAVLTTSRVRPPSRNGRALKSGGAVLNTRVMLVRIDGATHTFPSFLKTSGKP